MINQAPLDEPRIFESDFQTYTVCTQSKHWDSELKLLVFLLVLLLLRTVEAKEQPESTSSDACVNVFTLQVENERLKASIKAKITWSLLNVQSISSQITADKTR